MSLKHRSILATALVLAFAGKTFAESPAAPVPMPPAPPEPLAEAAPAAAPTVPADPPAPASPLPPPAPATETPTEAPMAGPVEGADAAAAPVSPAPAPSPNPAPTPEPSAPAPSADAAATSTPPAPASAPSVAASAAPRRIPGPPIPSAPEARSIPERERSTPADDSAGGCLLGEMCMGPILTLGGINPFGVGLQARYDEDWGIGVDYQFLPSVGIDNASASVSLLTVDARFYPTRAFFLSGGFALQRLTASATTSVYDVDEGNFAHKSSSTVRVEGNLTLPMAKFGLGLLGSEGFVMGIDLAVGVPLGNSTVGFEVDGTEQMSEESRQEIASMQEDIQEFADVAVDMLPVLVQVNLLRIGYIF